MYNLGAMVKKCSTIIIFVIIMIDRTVSFPHNTAVKISPNGEYICECTLNGMRIRNTQTFSVDREIALPWKSERIKWSPDSTLICCLFEDFLFPLIQIIICIYMFTIIFSNKTQNIAQIISLEIPSWKCELSFGALGCSRIKWSPDSRHILGFSNYSV